MYKTRTPDPPKRKSLIGSLSFVTAVLLISLLTVSVFWLMLPARFRVSENTDYISYYEPVARSLLRGDGFVSLDETTHAVRYPPGYPVLLAILLFLSHHSHISETSALSAFSFLCTGLASVFIFQIARSVWGARPALMSSLVWASYPLGLWYTKEPGTELPFVAIFYGAFCVFWYALLRKTVEWSTYFLIGLLIGCAMLVRPIAIGAGFLMAAILWLVASSMTRRLRLYLIAILLLGNIVAIAPWEAWIYFKTGKIQLLSTGGLASIRDGLAYSVNSPYRKVGSVPADIVVLMQDIESVELRSLGDVISLASKELLERPVAVAKLFVLKALRSWYGTDSQRFETPLMLINVIYVLAILWATRASWKLGGTAKQLSIAVWLVVFYFWGMTTMVLSIARYMVPAMGLSFTLLPACHRTFKCGH